MISAPTLTCGQMMARVEEDRDDLFAEFQSAIMKWELKVVDCDTTWIIGIRRDDRLSIYFGPDPCFHFDNENRLQRAYVDGALYRTQGATLAKLIRERTETVTQLNRHDLTQNELQEFRTAVLEQLKDLREVLETSQFIVTRHDSTAGLPETVSPRLAEILENQLPLAPAFPTRKS